MVMQPILFVCLCANSHCLFTFTIWLFSNHPHVLVKDLQESIKVASRKYIELIHSLLYIPGVPGVRTRFQQHAIAQLRIKIEKMPQEIWTSKVSVASDAGLPQVRLPSGNLKMNLK